MPFEYNRNILSLSAIYQRDFKRFRKLKIIHAFE